MSNHDSNLCIPMNKSSFEGGYARLKGGLVASLIGTLARVEYRASNCHMLACWMVIAASFMDVFVFSSGSKSRLSLYVCVVDERYSFMRDLCW